MGFLDSTGKQDTTASTSTQILGAFAVGSILAALLGAGLVKALGAGIVVAVFAYFASHHR